MSVMDLSFQDQNHQMEVIRECHDVAYVFVEQAICFEEVGREGEALEMYYKGLKHLNEGLAIHCDRPYCIGDRWDDARRMQGKMLRIRTDVHERIRVLSKNSPNASEVAQRTGVVPTYEASQSNPPSFPPLYPNLDSQPPPTYAEATNSVPQYSTVPDAMQCSARLLLRIPNGVQVFHISNGQVNVQSEPTELNIYTLNKAFQPISSQSVTWIQVAEFTYPLVPKRSPVLKTGYGAYMFPEVALNGDTNDSVALVLSADVIDEQRFQLDSILGDYAAFEIQPQLIGDTTGVVPHEPTFGQKVSEGIVVASEAIHRGLLRGAEATSVAINFGTEKLKERLQPERAAEVDPRVKTGLKVARATSHVACKVSGFVVGAVGDMTVALGKRIAKSIAQPDTVDGVQQNSALNDAILIAGGGVTGFANVFMGLEASAKILASSITNNTVTIVNHRYGERAGEAVGDAMYSVGNLALTANNVSNLGVRGIAKRTAKETGKAVLNEYINQQPTAYQVEEPPEGGPSTSQYPEYPSSAASKHHRNLDGPR